MHATRTLLIKKRRGYFELLRHRLMYKIYANFNAWGPEGRITFESNQDMWLNRLDAIEGENAASQQITAESDQFNADYAANAGSRPSYFPEMTALEAEEANFQLPPGEMPFYNCRNQQFYDIDRKVFIPTVAPFWWKHLPGDEGLAANRPMYYVGEGKEYLEPTLDHQFNANDPGARFLPATPEEAAEIEAEEKYQRDVRNSMMQAVTDLKIVEVPPFHIIGQKTHMSVTPWYKAKRAKNQLDQQTDGATSWEELVAWKTHAA